MDLRPVLYVVGIFLCILAAAMALPIAIDFYDGSPDWKVFFLSLVITAFFGGSLTLSNTGKHFKNITVRQAFLLTGLSWVTIALFAALPFYFSALKLSFTDAFFEAMSGITTTGSTVITGLDEAPRGILLWRAILQWLGGVGFIVMAMSILPFLKIGGMRLFRTESSEREKAMPRTAQLAGSIGLLYLALTTACIICYILTGVGLFDAVAHAMTTLSTGGFGTSDSSMAYFAHPGTELFAIAFMLIGSLPFVLYIKAVRGNAEPLLRDTQVRWFLGFILISVTLLTLYLVFHENMEILDSLRHAAFNVVSIITTTGYASTDYMLWGGFAISLFLFLTFVGGCAGSTAGAIKIFRFEVLFGVLRTQMKKLLHPHGVFIASYNRNPVPEDVMMSVMGFFFVYTLMFALGVIALSFVGLDFLTAMSAPATAISNVGPGLGEIIGPAGNFKPLPDSAKWILSAAMLLGRLELYPILVILSPHFWRH